MDATVLSRRKGRVEIKVELSCDPACWFDSGGWEPYCTDNGVYVRWVDTDPTNPVALLPPVSRGRVNVIL